MHREFRLKRRIFIFACIDVDDELTRVEEAGGKILQHKTQISEDIGYMAILIDTEGNRVALHSNQ